MTGADARALIESFTQWNVGAGQLLATDIDRLVTLARTTDAAGHPPDDHVPWQPSTAYALDAEVVPTARNGFLFAATVAGTSGATEPTWPAALDLTVVDGTVTWTATAVAPWLGAYDVREAAAVGWEWRAAKLNDQFTVAVGSGRSFDRSWSPEFCLRMAHEMRNPSGTSGLFSVQLRTYDSAVL